MVSSEVIGALFAFGAAFFWVSAAPLYNIGRERLTTLELAGVRNALPVAVMSIVMLYYAKDISRWSAAVLVAVTAATIINAGLGDIIYLESLKRGGVGVALPAAWTYPVFSGLFAVIFLGEEFTYLTLFSLAFTVAGIWSLKASLPDDKDRVLMGVLLGTAASLCWSVGIILYAFSLEDVPAVPVAAMRTIIIGLIMAPVGVKALKRNAISGRGLLIVNVAAVLGVSIGSLCFYQAIATIGATRSAIITATGPLISTVLAVAIAKEKITRRHVLGAFLITVGSSLAALM